MKYFPLITICLFISFSSFAQVYTHADTLRGTNSPERSCYDVKFYDINLNVNVRNRSINGYNIIRYKVVNTFSKMQVDLFSNMKIDSIMGEGQKLSYVRNGNAVFVTTVTPQQPGTENSITVWHHGKPQEAINPPWDGGFVWKKDPNGKDWVGLACEGTGASCWLPCKDYLGDEPDSAHMKFTVPSDLYCVSNGQLRDKKINDNGTSTWFWAVTYPINSYNITFNLADYSTITDTYIGADGRKLPLHYYVLKGEEQKAQQHFTQVKQMMACYEKYFGPYPFYRDGYSLVETTYWGMEHQSAISYGNNYLNNKFGFDFIIIHESAHEWWGNNISCSDHADMWIHESFATYAEALFVECTKGYDTAVDYLKNQRWNIKDEYPMIGHYGVNAMSKDNDIYYKGAWMLHTFRNVLNNDSLFFAMLKGLQQHFAYKTTNTDEVIDYINKTTGKDYTSFFRQYLNYTQPPVLQYQLTKSGKDLEVKYRWKTDVHSFDMPVKITSSSTYQFGKTTRQYIRVQPTADSWQTIRIPDLKATDFDVDTDEFYVRKEEVKK